MTQAFNLSQLANNLNSSGQLDATDGLNGLVPIANGGTNAGNASDARTNLGVAISSDVMPWVAPSTAGNVLTSNGSVWTSATPSAGGGSFTYIASATASSSATIDFTGLDTTTYSQFYVTWSMVRHSTGAGANWLYIRFYVGGTLITTSSYQYAGAGYETSGGTATTGAVAGAFGTYANSTFAATTAGLGTSGWLIFGNISGSGVRSSFSGQSMGSTGNVTNALWATNWGGQFTNTTNVINGIRFYPGSGTLAAGSFKIYGIKAS